MFAELTTFLSSFSVYSVELIVAVRRASFWQVTG